MATPTLTGLPVELLDQIILLTMPEGLESLALTCTGLYQLCAPFIQRHHRLRAEFQRYYHALPAKGLPSTPTISAIDLIMRIASEPVVARYIRYADFSMDGYCSITDSAYELPDADDGGPVVALFANSPYLRQAGLDWREYYTSIKDDFKIRSAICYSHYAAAFLLTLLPNVKTLVLPIKWHSKNDQTGRLLTAVAQRARLLDSPSERPSLAQLTEFNSSGGCRDGRLDSMLPFLALPRMRVFHGPNLEAAADASGALASRYPHLGYGEALEVVHFSYSCFDDIAIADFLRHTPRLKTLTYGHFTESFEEWDICKFVTAIEREAGSHLEELSINVRDSTRLIKFATASMSGFRCLRKLEFPLQIAVCTMFNAAKSFKAPAPGQCVTDQLHMPQPFISNLVPASVSQLSLRSSGGNGHDTALKVMFSNFAATKRQWLPALEEIHIRCHDDSEVDDRYVQRFTKLLAGIGELGVLLHVYDETSLGTPTCDKEDWWDLDT